MTTILLVDDEAALIRVLKNELEEEGFKVVTANNGKQAMFILKAQEINLVLTDIVMPDMEGLELINRVSKNWPEIKIIAMSGGGRTLDQGKCLQYAKEAGAHHTFTKPFDSDDLTLEIKKMTSDTMAA